MPRRRIPVVVLVGRPNVGKSTLFNRITGSRRAIVTPVPGTTRDVIGQKVTWGGCTFELADTGGMYGASEDPLHALVIGAGRKALLRADVVVFVVDGREGRTPGDEEIAKTLRMVGKPVVLAVNKLDDRRAAQGAIELLAFGFDAAVEIAAEHGQGIGELLDEVIGRLPAGAGAVPGAPSDEGAEGESEAGAAASPAPIGVAIIGRPNVGKSSLVNRLLREDRVLVSDMPGTTRDAVDAVFRWHGRAIRLIDTAGIRRPGRVARAGQVESVSVIIARRSVETADVAVLVIDAVEGPTEQDGAVAGEAERAGCGVVVAVNKWDLVEDRGAAFAAEFDDRLHRRMKFLDYAPVVHISALTGERTPRLLETITRVADARRTRVTTGELNRFVATVTAAHPPASPGKKAVRVLYAAQVGVAPPSFVFFTNVATTFHFSYRRFLVNQIRDRFGFVGTPIGIQVRARRDRHEDRESRGRP